MPKKFPEAVPVGIGARRGNGMLIDQRKAKKAEGKKEKAPVLDGD